MNKRLAHYWLSVGALYLVVAGGVLAVAGVAAGKLFALGGQLAFGVGNEALAGPATGVARLATSVSGALTVFVGVLVWSLRPVFFHVEAGAAVRRAVLAAMGVWFVIDSVCSVWVGAAPNVGGNVSLLLAVAPPLLWRRSEH